MLDLIIIGGSAAGVSAGIYAKRRGLNFKIITKDIGGEVATSGIIENYLGFKKTTGIELAQKIKEQIEYNNIEVESETEVKKIEKIEKNFKIYTNNGKEYLSKSIIIATGSKPRKLKVPGEDKFYHKGLSYCTVCDGPLYKGKEVAIIGGGNSALEAALMMAELSPKVYLINKNPYFKGDAIYIKKVESLPNIEVIYNALTTEIKGNTMVESLIYKDISSDKLKEIFIKGIFVHIGMTPNSEFIDFVEKDNYGYIKIDLLCRTSQPGIFAAGDITSFPYHQISIAVGQGATALLSCVSYLNSLGD